MAKPNDKFTWSADDLVFDDDVDKYNVHHNPAGPGGGQFASGGGLDAAIASALHDKGGFTFNPVTVDAPTHGYAVGGYGTVAVDDVETFDADDVKEFLAKNAEAFKAKDTYLGGWIDKGKVYLDVTKVFPENQRDEAINAGHAKDQIAIADLTALNAGRTSDAIIATGGTGKAAPGKRTMFLLDPRSMTAEEMHAKIVEMIELTKAT